MKTRTRRIATRLKWLFGLIVFLLTLGVTFKEVSGGLFF